MGSVPARRIQVRRGRAAPSLSLRALGLGRGLLRCFVLSVSPALEAQYFREHPHCSSKPRDDSRVPLIKWALPTNYEF